jgi:hypothetical protein
VADQKHRSAVERFLNKTPPQHEPEVEGQQVRDAFEEVRAPKTRGREAAAQDSVTCT